MLGKTHLAVGVAASLLFMPIGSINECVMALMGGAVGSVIADVDVLDDDSIRNVTKGELTVFGIGVAILAIDFFRDGGICRYFLENQTTAMFGILGLLLFLMVGYFTDHRSFTHSILAMGIVSYCAAKLYPGLGVSAAIGYASHLALDVLNRKKVRLFFPIRKGICFRLCYANRKANKILLFTGTIVSGILLIIRLISIFAAHSAV